MNPLQKSGVNCPKDIPNKWLRVRETLEDQIVLPKVMLHQSKTLLYGIKVGGVWWQISDNTTGVVDQVDYFLNMMYRVVV